MSSNEETRSSSGNGNGNGNGEEIQDDLRCKRSDGKQWRCTAMSMPDKTVCKKHYFQAKKRAASSASKANQKKVKTEETYTYSQGKIDGFEIPIEHYRNGPESAMKNGFTTEKRCDVPMMRNLNNEFVGNVGMFEERNRSMSPMEYSAASTDVSAESLGQNCHQCQRKDRDRIVSCLNCNQRAFCDTCISIQYSEISIKEVEKVCPVCRGLCDCKHCLRSDNTVKVRIREIPVLDKLQYLYRLLSAVLPVIKQIHIEQCAEVELEKRLRGAEIDLVRARLKADEQMCCNVCRIPVIDYYRHCSNCSYDLCLRCCQDLRAEFSVQISGANQIIRDETGAHKLKLNFSYKFPKWEANGDGSIPCPPKEYGGCGSRSLNLARIFKMNWVAKLVKNAEEMVNGCKACDLRNPESSDREASGENSLSSLWLDTVKSNGVANFEKQWAEGRPVIVKRVLDESSLSRWDPETIWRDVDDISDEKLKEHDPFLKAINCLDGSEFDVRLGAFTKAYKDGRNQETGLPLLWKLKEWPSPSASEKFIFYQRPEFIRRFPFLEYIHPRLGLLNVAAKLPHYSLQSDAGPKINVSSGAYKEIGDGDSLASIQYNMRDMVYVLVHTSEEKKLVSGEPEVKMNENESLLCLEEKLKGGELHYLSLGRVTLDNNESEMMLTVNTKNVSDHRHIMESTCTSSFAAGGAKWDVFRRQDVPKLVEYLQRTFQKPDNFKAEFVSSPLYEGLFLNEHHKRQLKDKFGVEPWTYEQHRGDAIFIPAGCPFQVKNLQSNVQVTLDFLCPESVGESARLAEEIRCLPNDHEAKLQILEIGKISLYAASSAIKEMQKLVLDPKFGAELGFEDHNLTKAVSHNLDKAIKRPQEVTCT
ncbi:unnamed protein product [Cochlearia groenlandica]